MAIINKHKSTPNQSTQYLTLQETTGVFGILNPGGYGASQTPTGERGTSAILSSNFFILKSTGSVTYNGGTTFVLVDSLYSTTYNNTNAILIANGTTQSFDLATLIGINYIDGVYKTVYYNWFFPNVSSIVEVTNGSTLAQVSNVDEFVNAKFFKDENTGTFYEIASVDELTNTITFTIAWQGLTGDLIEGSYSIAYASTAYFANTYNINKCLHFKISQLALSNCTCKNKTTEKLYEAVMLYMSIQPNIDLGKYTKAQEIINALTIYCNGGECNC